MYSNNTENPGLDGPAFSFFMDDNHVGNGYTLTGDLPQLPPVLEYEDTQRAQPPFVCTSCMAKHLGLLSPEDSGVPENTNPNTQAGCSHRSTTPLPNVPHHQIVSPLDTATRGISLGLGLSSASTTFHRDNAAGQANNFVDDQTRGRCFDICKSVERTSSKYKCHWNGCTSHCEFASEQTLIRHLKSVHISPDKYKCPRGTCNESFGRKDKLRAHIKSDHKG